MMNRKQRHIFVALLQHSQEKSLSDWVEGYSEDRVLPPDALLEREWVLLRLSLQA